MVLIFGLVAEIRRSGGRRGPAAAARCRASSYTPQDDGSRDARRPPSLNLRTEQGTRPGGQHAPADVPARVEHAARPGAADPRLVGQDPPPGRRVVPHLVDPPPADRAAVPHVVGGRDGPRPGYPGSTGSPTASSTPRSAAVTSGKNAGRPAPARSWRAPSSRSATTTHAATRPPAPATACKRLAGSRPTWPRRRPPRTPCRRRHPRSGCTARGPSFPAAPRTRPCRAIVGAGGHQAG
jgi:hypothetical protein